MTDRFSSLALCFHLLIRRCNWIYCLAFGLPVLAVAVSAWPVRHLQSNLTEIRVATTRARQTLETDTLRPPAETRTVAQDRIGAFYEHLGERRHMEQQVKTLFAVAAKVPLALHRAEYRFGTNQEGGFHTYQITLPVKGTYEEILRFCDLTLLAITFASLDEINFKRESIAASTLDANLRFTLYLVDAAQDAIASVRVPEDVAR